MIFSRVFRISLLFLLSLNFLCDCKRIRRPIFVDDYGQDVDDSDCPTDKNSNPKFIFNNMTWAAYFSLTCLAPYPITIDFEGHRDNLLNARLLLSSANPTNQSKACYVVNLSTYLHRSYYSPIGNYNCKSLSNSTQSTSFYVFAKDNWGRLSSNPFNTDAIEEVFINKNNVSKLYIPCPSTKEVFTTAILRKEKDDGERIDLEKEDHYRVIYDLKSGFTVEFPFARTENSSDLDGKYHCIDSSTSTSLEVDVKHVDYIAFPNKTNLTFDYNNQITFECYGGGPVSLKVLNKTGKIQEQKILSFSISKEYKDTGFIYYAKTILTSSDPKASGEIACVNSSGSPFVVWKFDNEYRCQCEWNASSWGDPYYGGYRGDEDTQGEFGESPGTTLSPYTSGDYSYFNQPFKYGEISCWNGKAQVVSWDFMPCTNDIECQIASPCIQKTTCPAFQNFNRYYGNVNTVNTNRSTQFFELRPGILRCIADEFVSFSKITTDLEYKMYFNGEKSKDLIRIKAGETHLYTGDKMIFSCSITSYHLISQIVWGFEHQDKSITYPEVIAASNRNYYNRNDQVSTGLMGSIRTSFLTIPDKDVKKLWCYAPQWNSTEWVKTSIDLKIEDAIPAEDPPKCPQRSNPFIVMYRNSSISKQRVRLPHIVDGTDSLVFDPVETVSLYCLSKFPVMWLKDGLNISAARTSRAHCKNEKGSLVGRALYKSTVIFHVAEYNATGNYTCKSTTPNQARQSSVYIYAIYHENRTSFVNEGHHYLVRHNYENYSTTFNKWATLPCRVNNPTFIPYLFIDHPEEEKIEKVSRDNSFLKFDSKTGFSIDITNRIIKNETTVFICSDHKDGSFIGNMVTLELIYDINAATVKPTNSSVGTTITKIPITLKPTIKATVPPPVTMQPQYESSSNAGFIVTIVMLVSFCCACMAVIYYLYQKIIFQQKINPPPPQELDWAHATVHTGNNIGSLIETQNNLANNIDNLPSLSENDFNYSKLI